MPLPPPSPSLAPFAGCWHLDLSASDYAGLPAPEAATYAVLATGDRVRFHARWHDTTGTHQMAFEGTADGSHQPIADTDLALSCRVDDGALITEVFTGDTILQTATRRVDGDALTVTQELPGPGGTSVTVTSTYRRTGVKQVICYRRDLKMRKGKIAAQCAHASMAVFFRHDTGDHSELRVALDGPMAVWSKGSFAKVVLSVETEEDLLKIHQEAQRRGLPTALITDAGRTEFHGVPTKTAVAVGPATLPEIDAITGPSGLVATKLA